MYGWNDQNGIFYLIYWDPYFVSPMCTSSSLNIFFHLFRLKLYIVDSSTSGWNNIIRAYDGIFDCIEIIHLWMKFSWNITYCHIGSYWLNTALKQFYANALYFFYYVKSSKYSKFLLTNIKQIVWLLLTEKIF